jgi:hypothetical protein
MEKSFPGFLKRLLIKTAFKRRAFFFIADTFLITISMLASF